LRPFVPLFKNPHLLTIAANFWQRPSDESRFPIEAKLYNTEPGVQVLVHTQRPQTDSRAELILVHGLEGSSESGYAVSLAHAALEAGYTVHRFNMRSCGGTEAVCGTTLYHSGHTCDLLWLLREFRSQGRGPFYLTGFSLGGNVVLKLAGELSGSAPDLIAAVCAVSTPIDLAACARRLGARSNFLYADRFLKRLRERVRLKEQLTPGLFDLSRLPGVKTIWDFDNTFTAPSFGFGTADNYYATQSAARFLDRIRVPTLLIHAQDDPLVPFEIYNLPVFRENPHLTLVAPDHGGHVGFLSRSRPRFWLDSVLLEWLEEAGNKVHPSFVS